MTARLTDYDRELITAAREIADLADAAAVRAYTGEDNVALAYAVAFGRAQVRLGQLLAIVERVAGADGEDTGRLDSIRALPAAFDWERDDRQLALEAIDRIADGDLDEVDELADDGDLDDLEAYCAGCGADIGIFIGHGDAWLHYTGEGTVPDPVELYDAGHPAEVAWRPPACRVCGHRPHPEAPAECATCPEGYCEARPAGAR